MNVLIVVDLQEGSFKVRIAEIDAATGTTLREYIYVNGQQIAIVDDTDTPDEATYFVHNDHLGTPQKITDDAQAEVWSASYQPFGEVDVEVATIENNIRFPGQYADEETGLHYNYFRDYNPSLGRYVESDPIGLEGGFNSYAYVYNNPNIYTDPTGELVPLVPLVVILGKFGVGMAIDVSVQVYTKGRDCINWTEAVVSGILSAAPVPGLGAAKKTVQRSRGAVKELTRQHNRAKSPSWRAKLGPRITAHKSSMTSALQIQAFWQPFKFFAKKASRRSESCECES